MKNIDGCDPPKLKFPASPVIFKSARRSLYQKC